MRILCLNAWGGTLQDRLLPYLAAADADVLCLQEVIHSPATQAEVLTYRDGDHVLPQRANLFRDVGQVLPDHVGFFCPAARGVLWDGEQAVPSLWGVATFVRASLQVIGQIQGFVHKDFSAHGYGDHPRSRSAHGVRVYDYVSDRGLSVLHMHGLRDRGGKHDTPERAAQADRFLTFANTLKAPGEVCILCGDFNVEPDSETLALIGEAGFTELVTDGGFAGTRTSFYAKSGKFADYMLVNDPTAVRDFQVVREPEVSDHCPLQLDL